MTITQGKIVTTDLVRPVGWMGEQGRFLLRAEDTGGLFSFFEVTSSPGAGPPLHLHHAYDETFFVTQGAYMVQLGDDVHELGPGELVFGPRGVPHKFRNISDEPSRLMVIATPGGVERFFEGLSRLTAGGPPDPAAMIELATAHQITGLEPVGPPGPPTSRERR